MGTLTTNLKLYKPDPTEFVDADVQINRNWDITDQAVRRCLEYEYTSLAVPDVSDSVTPRSKFYKPYSNSLITYIKNTNTWYQDPSAFVAAWNGALFYFSEGYNFSPTGFEVHVRLVKKSGGSTAEVEWSGAFYELGGTMELNTNVTVIPPGVIPSQFTPTVTKYFNVYAGNTSSDFSMARIFIGSDGSMQFKRYGVNPSAGTSDENRVELTGILYNVEVSGT